MNSKVFVIHDTLNGYRCYVRDTLVFMENHTDGWYLKHGVPSALFNPYTFEQWYSVLPAKGITIFKNNEDFGVMQFPLLNVVKPVTVIFMQDGTFMTSLRPFKEFYSMFGPRPCAPTI